MNNNDFVTIFYTLNELIAKHYFFFVSFFTMIIRRMDETNFILLQRSIRSKSEINKMCDSEKIRSIEIELDQMLNFHSY